MATIIDVAKAAGVAPSTVSYVLSGKRPISPATRRLVEDAIRKVGYQRYGRGRSQDRSRTGVVAVITSPLLARFPAASAELIAAISVSAWIHGLDLLLAADSEGSAAMHRIVSGAVADAAIVLDVEPGDPRLPALLCSDLPAVLLGSADNSGLSCVRADLIAGATAGARHLASLGHRSIAYLEGPATVTTFRWAFAETAAQQAMSITRRACLPSTDAVRRRLAELLAHNRPTALVVDDEALLWLALAELDRRGVRIPCDLSVLAVGPAGVVHRGVPLTSVSVPPRELGEAAVAAAVYQLTEPTTTVVRLLPARLSARGSTTDPRNLTLDRPITRAG